MHPILVLTRVATVLGICMGSALATGARGPRTDTPRHVRRSARDEGWERRLRQTAARREACRPGRPQPHLLAAHLIT
jgi:hypothetical protein